MRGNARRTRRRLEEHRSLDEFRWNIYMDEGIFRWSRVMTSSAGRSIHFPWAASAPVRSGPPKVRRGGLSVRRSALNIGFVDKLPSRLQGHWFSKSAWSSSFWSVGARKPGFSARTAAPARIYLPENFVAWGDLTSAIRESRACFLIYNFSISRCVIQELDHFLGIDLFLYVALQRMICNFLQWTTIISVMSEHCSGRTGG